VIEGLSHIRVVDFTTEIAGPYCTKLLADAGADVIKVEPPDGDPARRTTATGADLQGEDSALFRFLNTSKRSVVGRPGDPHVDDLVAGADLVVEDLGHDFDVDGLRARHPHLVAVSITPFGRSGPIADRPATEFTVQAESGSILYRGRPTREPVQAGGRVSEFVGGAYAAPPAIAAVLRARRTGVGEHVDVSIAEGMAIAASTFADLSHHLHGRPELTAPIRNLETPSIERAADGWVGFNTNTGQMFQNFLLLIDRPDLLDDKELATFGGRMARGEEWRQIINANLGTRTVDDIVARAAELRIPVAPVCNGETIRTNEHLLARGVFVDNPAGFVQPRPPYLIEGEHVRAFSPAPALGEHTSSVEARPAPVPTDPDDADPVALPCAGLKVLDLTSWWAGPSSTQFLVAMGAEVIHVESTSHPDGMRMTGYMYGRPDWWEWGHMFVAVNPDKLGITLDLGSEQGRALCVRLIEWADVVVENFAPRVAEHWGFDRDGVLAINPNVVYCRMPAFGLSGPWRERVGFAQTMEQLTMAWITGYPDDQPMIPRGPCDPLAGLHSAVAMLAALAERDRTGRGVFIESTMLEAALNACAQPIIEFSAYGRIMERIGNRSPYCAPQGVYACAGFDEWLALSIATDEQWQSLRRALGDPRWADDPELDTFAGRVAKHDVIDDRLGEWAVGVDDLDVAVDTLVAHGVPAARAWDPRIISRHPQFVARGFFEELDHPSLGTHPVPGMPYRFASVDRWTHRATATMGQDNHDVLTRILGLTDSEVAQLEADGIIGTQPKGL
jgi:crotonobetainyl-CoA:carnitine CoA-transferase CaiB-like acyl-CoA transferase